MLSRFYCDHLTIKVDSKWSTFYTRCFVIWKLLYCDWNFIDIFSNVPTNKDPTNHYLNQWWVLVFWQLYASLVLDEFNADPVCIRNTNSVFVLVDITVPNIHKHRIDYTKLDKFTLWFNRTQNVPNDSLFRRNFKRPRRRSEILRRLGYIYLHDDVTKWKHFLVTGHMCVEFTGHRWIPRTKSSDAELWCFLWSAPE